MGKYKRESTKGKVQFQREMGGGLGGRHFLLLLNLLLLLHLFLLLLSFLISALWWPGRIAIICPTLVRL